MRAMTMAILVQCGWLAVALGTTLGSLRGDKTPHSVPAKHAPYRQDRLLLSARFRGYAGVSLQPPSLLQVSAMTQQAAKPTVPVRYRAGEIAPWMQMGAAAGPLYHQRSSVGLDGTPVSIQKLINAEGIKDKYTLERRNQFGQVGNPGGVRGVPDGFISFPYGHATDVSGHTSLYAGGKMKDTSDFEDGPKTYSVPKATEPGTKSGRHFWEREIQPYAYAGKDAQKLIERDNAGGNLMQLPLSQYVHYDTLKLLLHRGPKDHRRSDKDFNSAASPSPDQERLSKVMKEDSKDNDSRKKRIEEAAKTDAVVQYYRAMTLANSIQPHPSLVTGPPPGALYNSGGAVGSDMLLPPSGLSGLMSQLGEAAIPGGNSDGAVAPQPASKYPYYGGTFGNAAPYYPSMSPSSLHTREGTEYFQLP